MAMSKPDLSEFFKLAAYSEAKPCAVRAVLDGLAPQEQEQLQAALAEVEISNSAISKWLHARDHKVSWQAVRTHRMEECRCGKED
jgi:hypothetical protein